MSDETKLADQTAIQRKEQQQDHQNEEYEVTKNTSYDPIEGDNNNNETKDESSQQYEHILQNSEIDKENIKNTNLNKNTNNNHSDSNNSNESAEVVESQQGGNLIISESSSSSVNHSSSSHSSSSSHGKDQTNAFNEKIRSKTAESLRKSILEFIREMQQSTEKNKASIKKKTMEKIEEFEIEFERLFGVDESEGIEDIIIKPLHEKLLNVYPLKTDKRLEFYFRVYEFIKLEWLQVELDVLKHPMYAKAIMFIHKINEVCSSREKLQMISNVCMLLSKALQATQSQQTIGADHLLPTLIYALINAKPSRPYANLLFALDFRSHWKLKGAEKYYVATYQSALDFIDNIDAKKLRIDENIFDDLYHKNYQKFKDLGYLHDFERQKRFQGCGSSKEAFQIIEKLKKNMNEVHKMIEDIDNPNGNEEETKLKYLNSQLHSLKLTSLPEMFAEYAQMVDAYRDVVEKSQAVIAQFNQLSNDKDSEHLENNKKTSKSFLKLIF